MTPGRERTRRQVLDEVLRSCGEGSGEDTPLEPLLDTLRPRPDAEDEDPPPRDGR